jgi:site-specific recombinase XerD
MNEVLQIHRRFCDYCLVFKGNTKQTIRWYKESIKYLVEHSKAEKISDISKHTVEDWLLWGKLERDWAPKTIRNRLQSLSLFFEWCVQEKYMPENPCANIPKPKLPKRIPKHLSKEQALKLLDWARHFKYDYTFERKRGVAIIAMFIYTGIRLEELRELKMQDIDFSERTVFVKSGKGEKDRVVPMSLRLMEILEEYIKDRKRMKKESIYFFTALRSDEQMGEKVIPRLVKRLREKSGVYFYPHLLRHTFATLMLEGGCDLFSLSKMMGHSDIKTTTIYLSATVTHLQEQILKHPLNV